MPKDSHSEAAEHHANAPRNRTAMGGRAPRPWRALKGHAASSESAWSLRPRPREFVACAYREWRAQQEALKTVAKVWGVFETRGAGLT